MNKHEATAVDQESLFGLAFRPTFRSFSGVGTFIATALSQFRYDTGLGIQKVTGGYTVRRLTGSDLTTQEAQAVTDLGTSLTKITGADRTGNSYTWTFDDGTNTYETPSKLTLQALIDALLDGSYSGVAATPGALLNDTVVADDWIFVNLATATVYFGAGSGTFETNFTTPIPNPEVELTEVTSEWI